MISAYILGKVEPKAEQTVVTSLKVISEITEAEVIFGQYDFIARVEAKNEEHLKSVLTEKVRLLPGVASTMTLIAQKLA